MDLLSDGTSGLAYVLMEQIGDHGQLAAVRVVAEGGSWIDPRVVGAMVTQTIRRASSPLRDLTLRELQVLEQMAQGRTNASIADHLGLLESSIAKCSTSLFSRLRLNRRTQYPSPRRSPPHPAPQPDERPLTGRRHTTTPDVRPPRWRHPTLGATR